ncbi:hypothetical protein PR048_028549 [Dryococelus australis]|uniref:Uncharacterized protein n=1 Tax=Dryococelus australis TaxID=614101 RepID=A0ABQ9GAW6_9NEOP|nr:hypothetical protein PR048_028549 [Dryococelus australis]
MPIEIGRNFSRISFKFLCDNPLNVRRSRSLRVGFRLLLLFVDDVLPRVMQAVILSDTVVLDAAKARIYNSPSLPSVICPSVIPSRTFLRTSVVLEKIHKLYNISNIIVSGAAVAERLARPPPIKTNRVQSPAGPPDSRMWEPCRTMPLVGGSSRGYLVSQVPVLLHAHLSHPHRLSRRRRYSELRRDVQGVLTSGLCVLCGLVRETSSARREIQLLQPYGWYKGPSTPPALSFGNDERGYSLSAVEDMKWSRRGVSNTAICWPPASHVAAASRQISVPQRFLTATVGGRDWARVLLRVYNWLGVLQEVSGKSWTKNTHDEAPPLRAVGVDEQETTSGRSVQVQAGVGWASLPQREVKGECAPVHFLSCVGPHPQSGPFVLAAAHPQVVHTCRSKHSSHTGVTSRSCTSSPVSCRDELNQYFSGTPVPSRYLLLRILVMDKLYARQRCSTISPFARIPWLNHSPHTKANRVQVPAGRPEFSHCGSRAGQCRWSADFLGDLPWPPPLHSAAAPFSPRITLIDSQDLGVKSCSNFFTHIPSLFHGLPLSIFLHLDFLNRLTDILYWPRARYSRICLNHLNAFVFI